MAKFKDLEEAQRELRFMFENPVMVRVYQDRQVSPDGKKFRLEMEMPEGPTRFTYEEFIRFAQSVAVLMKPSVLLED